MAQPLISGEPAFGGYCDDYFVIAAFRCVHTACVVIAIYILGLGVICIIDIMVSDLLATSRMADEGEEFVVDKILDKRVRNGKVRHYVRRYVQCCVRPYVSSCFI